MKGKKKAEEKKRENFVLIFPDTKSKMRTVKGNKEKEKMTEKIKYIKQEKKKRLWERCVINYFLSS